MKKTLNRMLNPRPVTPARQAPRLLAALGALALLGGVGLLASRPVHSAGGPVPVTVANTPSVTSTDTAYQQPFAQHTLYVIQDGTYSGILANGSNNIKVPVGKRLVIQSVSAYREGAITQNVKVNLYSGNTDLELPTIVPDGTPSPSVTLSVTATTESGSTLNFGITRSGTTGTEYVGLYVNGYLVNV